MVKYYNSLPFIGNDSLLIMLSLKSFSFLSENDSDSKWYENDWYIIFSLTD
jgi:hypothetical protein